MTRYISLAEYFWLAEQVTNTEAAVLTKAARVDLADSALHAPAAGFGDEDFYPDVLDKAAVLTCRLAWNHPLPDGNKRGGVGGAIPRLRRALIAPRTTAIRGLGSAVALEPGEDPVPRSCVANLDSVESVSVGVLVERLGGLADGRIREMCRALEVAVDCHTSPAVWDAVGLFR